MHQGYVKLWRKSIDSRVFKDPYLWKVWTWCLMQANHKGKWVYMETGKGSIEVWLDPGQFIFGRESAAKMLDMKPSSVRNRMEKLKTLQNLDIKADRQYSIISINNWTTYQSEDEKVDSDQDSEVDSQRTAKGQPKDTTKNDKNVKNNKPSSAKAPHAAVEFNAFWSAYPKKRDKGAALKAWKKINGTRPPIETILNAIEKQKQSADWIKDNGQFIPYPATWINGQRWEDEIEVQVKHQPSVHLKEL